MHKAMLIIETILYSMPLYSEEKLCQQLMVRALMGCMH